MMTSPLVSLKQGPSPGPSDFSAHGHWFLFVTTDEWPNKSTVLDLLLFQAFLSPFWDGWVVWCVKRYVAMAGLECTIQIGWPWTYGNPLVSASGMTACATMPSLLLPFKTNFGQLSSCLLKTSYLFTSLPISGFPLFLLVLTVYLLSSLLLCKGLPHKI